ncbi:hypothetical protein ILUMI_10946 [Ignelater luminosus]|uniref:Uncharacterized protein n=1 Tax=Ignelater luminosus TaxID=2038154 RepID=A0A8K0CWW3_IGNLU|nr:hypothetical protein ILUMI_10946 [Ignelater luminosus]
MEEERERQKESTEIIENIKGKNSELEVGVKTLLDKQDERNTTYADKIKTRKYEPVLVIKPKSESQVNISGVKSASKGGIIIECKDKDALSKLKNVAESTLGNKYNINIPKHRTPRVKIIGMRHKKFKVKCCVRSNYETTKTESFFCYAEVDGETYRNLLGEEKVNIGWDQCRVSTAWKLPDVLNAMDTTTGQGIAEKGSCARDVLVRTAPIMTHMAETRRSRARSKRRIEMKILRRITNKTLRDRIPNDEIRRTCQIIPTEEWISRRKQEWNEYIEKMNQDRLVKMARNKIPQSARGEIKEPIRNCVAVPHIQEGRRLMALGYLFEQIFSAKNHGTLDCNITDIITMGLSTDNINNTSAVNTNQAAVLHMISSEIGYFTAKEMSVSNVPIMAHGTFLKHQNDISNIIDNTLWQQMAKKKLTLLDCMKISICLEYQQQQ